MAATRWIVRAALVPLLLATGLTMVAPALAEEDPDPALLDLQGLETLRALEEAAAAAPEAKQLSDPKLDAAHEAEQAAEADRRKADARVQTLIDEQLKIQAELADESKTAGAETEGIELGEANPRIAPGPPEERELPIQIFDSEEMWIPPGTWGNRRRLKVIALTLDADGNGKPELTRWIDRESKLQVRRHEDRNYDGVTDTWSDYEWGAIVARVLDSNDDGNPDVWERYEKERMVSREVDRDDDGVRDAFYRYEGDSLVEERHDSNNDGQVDLVILYEDRLRVSAEEDHDTDGKMDTWTTYVSVKGKEVITRIERDERGEGSVTMVEVFDTATGEAVIARKDEDVNGDGEIDVVSIYKAGRLVRREISDPALVEL